MAKLQQKALPAALQCCLDVGVNLLLASFDGTLSRLAGASLRLCHGLPNALAARHLVHAHGQHKAEAM